MIVIVATKVTGELAKPRNRLDITCGICYNGSKMKEEKFVVRLYDGFDNEWIDVSEPVSREEAEKILNEKTEDGTKNTKFDDIDYYAIFPEDTIMFYSWAGREKRGKA